MRARAVAALLVLALAGCTPPPESGYVLEKEYSAPYTWVQLVCSGYNAQGICTVQVPITHNEPAHWRLCLVDDQDQDFKGCREVDSETWSRYEVGDHYPDPR